MNTGFTVTLQQANGDQLSYEEIGLPAVYAVFLVVAVAQLGVHTWKHYVQGAIFAPLIVRCLTLLLSLHAYSDFAHMVDWALVANSGKGSTFLAVTAGLFRLFAEVAMWVLAFFAAVGHGISSSDANWRKHLDCKSFANLRGVLLLAGIIVTYLVVASVYAASGNSAPTRTAGGSVWAAIVLLALVIGYCIWFFFTMRATRAAEISVPKKTMLERLTYVIGGALIILPLVELISAFSLRLHEWASVGTLC